MALKHLPIKDGFRLRGEAVTRLETFVDAAFAFAVTLLVVSFDHVPGTYPELVDALKRTPAFFAGFGLIAMFWFAHNRFSRRYGLEDATVVTLSLALVAVVMVYIFPLRILMGSAMAFFTAGWAPSELQVGSSSEARAIYLIYGAGWLVMNGLLVLLNAHALRCADALQLNAIERWHTRVECQAYCLLATVGVVSMLLALLLPMNHPLHFALPGLAYGLLSVLMPAFGVFSNREQRRLMSADEEAA